MRRNDVRTYGILRARLDGPPVVMADKDGITRLHLIFHPTELIQFEGSQEGHCFLDEFAWRWDWTAIRQHPAILRTEVVRDDCPDLPDFLKEALERLASELRATTLHVQCREERPDPSDPSYAYRYLLITANGMEYEIEYAPAFCAALAKKFARWLHAIRRR